MKNQRIFSVVVTYNPEINLFENVIRSLCEQTDKVIVVDNFSSNRFEIQNIIKHYDAELIQLDKNAGIACAQNKGIEYAEKSSADYILLMDQDTILPEKSVSGLLAECISLEKKGLKVGAIGYAYRNTHDGQLNSVYNAQGLRLKKQKVGPEIKTRIEADYIIASGSLIPTQTLKDVGGMEEGLFIDLVDVEWGLRAKAKGYKNYISYSHIMTHTLGQTQKKILWHNTTIHTPIRNYYSIRNSLFLAKRPYIRWAWRVHYFKRVFPYFIAFGVFPDQKWLRIKLMIRGLKDGILNKNGPNPVA